jgi:flagellar motor switch protein FliN/FliY
MADTGSRQPPASPGCLPLYSRSLLRIKVPVVVTLAQKKQPLSRILELGPGSLIQFDKSCDAMLNLEVAARSVAVGEAVKVGDKFGLRISSITLPDERFVPLKKGCQTANPQLGHVLPSPLTHREGDSRR